MEASVANARFFDAGAVDGKFHFDLGGYVADRLRSAGVGSVEVLGLDTYADADQFFSYRRSTHKGEPDYGRLLSTIMLSKDTSA
jgi:copper oxidase (laccase) domain-containing protein